MPAFVAGAVAAAGTFAYVATYLAVTVIITAGLSYAMRPRRQRAGFESRFRDVTVRGTIEPMQMIYGQIKASGFIAFIGTSGALERFLNIVVVFAAHQCEDIGAVWLDSRGVADADIDPSGVVSTAAFQDGGSRLLVRRWLGTNAQTADSELVSQLTGIWTTSHRGAGLTYAYFRLDYSETVYPNGAPSSLFAMVSGRRLYDARLDSTNGGSGSHRFNDATTWAYNNLASLCVRDYLSGGSRWYDVATPEPRLGFAAPNSRIDDSLTIAATNIDDEDVLIPPAAPATTQKRYTCDVQLSCGDTYRENLRKLEAANAGKVSYVNGRYRIYSGAYDTPTITIEEDDIVGPMTVSPHPFGEELYNYVTGTSFDELRDWQELPFPNIVNSSFETADRGQFKREFRLEATRTSYRCQRIGRLHLAKSRHKKVVRFEKLSAKALSLTHHGTFMVNCSEYGFAAKVLRVIEPPEIMLPDLTVAVTAREEFSTSYTDPLVAEYAAPGVATVPTPSLEQPVVPTNFAARSMPEGIQFTWVAPTPRNNATMYHLYEHTAITPFSSAVRVWSGNALSVLLERTGFTTLFYWMTAELNGVESAATPVGNGLAASPSLQGFEGVFSDSFEHQDIERFYDVRAGAVTGLSYPADGENGGRVFELANGSVAITWKKNIPYDPAKLYVMTARVRRTVDGVSTEFVQVGVEGVAADGTTIINRNGTTSIASMYAFCASNTTWVDGVWQTFRGYLSGHSASPGSGANPNITLPKPAYSSGSTIVRFIRPCIYINPITATGTLQVDSIEIEEVTFSSGLGPNAATQPYAATDAGPDSFNPSSNGDGYLSFNGDGIDAASLLKGRLVIDAQQADVITLSNITLQVTWSGGSESTVSAQPVHTDRRSYAFEHAFTTLPANTAWTMRVGMSGNANITVQRATLIGEVIKR